MEQNTAQAQNQASGKKNQKKSKVRSYFKEFVLMVTGLIIIFSYIYQSTKQVYLNYEIVNKNKEISDLNISLMEAKVENERLKTNESVERVASEKLGMSYDKSDRVVVVKEMDTANEQQHDDDKRKISIFVKSLYEEANAQLKQFSFDNIINFLKGN